MILFIALISHVSQKVYLLLIIYLAGYDNVFVYVSIIITSIASICQVTNICVNYISYHNLINVISS